MAQNTKMRTNLRELATRDAPSQDAINAPTECDDLLVSQLSLIQLLDGPGACTGPKTCLSAVLIEKAWSQLHPLREAR